MVSVMCELQLQGMYTEVFKIPFNSRIEMAMQQIFDRKPVNFPPPHRPLSLMKGVGLATP